MKSYDIIQIPHAYSFVIGFYGVCNGNSDVGCVDYDMKLSDFRNVVDSVYEVDSLQNNTTFSWYKSDLYKTDLNHFDKLECGKAYYFVVKSGVGRVNIPHLYVSNSGTHNANARVTTDCDFIQTTPTPESACCNEFSNSILTTGTLNGTESLGGVKTFGFDFGGVLCFDALELTYQPSRYNFKTEDDSIVGYITTTGIFKNKKVRYTTPSDECYESIADTQNGFNILTKR